MGRYSSSQLRLPSRRIGIEQRGRGPRSVDDRMWACQRAAVVSLLSDALDSDGWARVERERAGRVEPLANSAVSVANSRDASRIPSLRAEGSAPGAYRRGTRCRTWMQSRTDDGRRDREPGDAGLADRFFVN
jgi:hypothetical protein